MTLRPRVLAIALAAAGAVPAQAQSPAPPTAARSVVQTADELPRRSIPLARLPSELLTAPLPEVLALAQQIERGLDADDARYEIRDAATQRQRLSWRLAAAQLRRDWPAARRLAAHIRSLQDKPGPRATSGLVGDLIGEQRSGGHDAAWLRGQVAQRFGGLSWAEAGDAVKALKSQLELLNPEVTTGLFRQQLDVMARNNALALPQDMAALVLTARAQLETLVPVRAAVLAGLQQVVDAQAAAASPKPDRWTPRTVTLPPDAKGTPVTLAVWDSGVDLALFTPAARRGLAFDDAGHPSPHLLRPLGEATPRWPQLRTLLKGAFDLRAGLDTADARQIRQSVAGLKAEQATAFQEDLALAGLYVHGTHVAGIAAAGNPFARLQAVTMLWSHGAVPPRPSIERSERAAANYRRIVDELKASGTRVVNMSWRYGPQALEGAMEYHGIGRDAEERKRLAAQWFAIERDALRDAIASAPGILFVAGSGNEDNSADFAEYIPAGLSLPNLITVGAVDQALEEASFSTFGRTVTVHANGAEVDSFLPGGDRAQLSGTSMASPQVANLAAKLLALKPELTPVQLRGLIVDGAEPRGRTRVVNPRRSFELAGLALPTP